jgi:hypothetical protein
MYRPIHVGFLYMYTSLIGQTKESPRALRVHVLWNQSS